MNMQAMLKQAQNMQREMLKVKDEIDKTTFNGESSFVSVTVNGKKEIVEVVYNRFNSYSFRKRFKMAVKLLFKKL